LLLLLLLSLLLLLLLTPLLLLLLTPVFLLLLQHKCIASASWHTSLKADCC
jgi:hypothetical protein